MTQSLILNRRGLLTGAGALALSACSPEPVEAGEAQYAASPYRRLSDAEWRRRLGDAAWSVLRREGTERPYTSPLNDEHRRGTFVCKGCDLPLFRSSWKFDSRTGWPSFYDVMAANIGRKRDFAIGISRTEYHCARCLGHQGHVFPDGPRPTGLRYCNNGVALKFVPA
ncbi:peptide-methionine (R)-S-oxide reductase MsrB [uncultured Brevundimonas sp.]|uniref:peptide-methionine (R)-S-oxide reductase MsrB n=1 Tax=uncultured Brevundimonas sp. TaxID=213418 RepID=UPI002623D9C3|nr:peptide-methionine (R)-S-oxide reductase MsrB [uncultured Brevundimonas sp.]